MGEKQQFLPPKFRRPAFSRERVTRLLTAWPEQIWRIPNGRKATVLTAKIAAARAFP